LRRILLSEIKDLVEYERVREAMRASVIALKQRRRVAVGDEITLLFENRETVIFQVQEMVRTERIVDPAKIQDEIDAYAPLLPEKGELSATLFIEIPGIALLPPEQARAAVNRFQGIDQGCVLLKSEKAAVAARFEGGHSKEEKLAAVQYLRFPVGPELARALQDPAQPVRLAVEHPRYRASSVLSPEVRAELLRDLAAPSS
jgi:hypothetical protein